MMEDYSGLVPIITMSKEELKKQYEPIDWEKRLYYLYISIARNHKESVTIARALELAKNTIEYYREQLEQDK